MLRQLEVLKKVCSDQNISLKQIDENGNFLELIYQGESYYFINAQTPFNRQDIVSVCKDKEFTSLTLGSELNIPKTKGYLDPNCIEQYKKYCKFNTLQEILDDVKNNFNFPIIIKPNRGSGGRGVQKCFDEFDLTKAIESNFNQENKDYDYVMLIQEFVDISQEYRVFCVDGTIELIYLKDNSKSIFLGNLSPLHWEGSRAVLIQDKNLLNQAQIFVEPIFKKLPAFWCGLDIVINKDGKMFLIEVNTNPGLSIFLEQNDEQIIYNLYRTAILKYFEWKDK